MQTRKTNQQKSVRCPWRRTAYITLLLLAFVFVIAWDRPLAASGVQQSFSSPEDAVKSLTEAVEAKNKGELDQIFGPAGKDLRSGDDVQESAELEELAKHLAEQADLVKETESKAILYVGRENWPFPIPIMKGQGRWFFDTQAGKEEILNRRIGENEMVAILVCRAYVKAQREYVLKDWDGDGIFAYAQKLRSDPGMKNGLFWRTTPDAPPSPLGELVARARHEGYQKKKAAFKDEWSPFHGYYFKIMTRQGKNAPGGAYHYIINDHMVGGFALAAFPANWGKSGVMTFIINQQGKVYQKNLGPETTKIVRKMQSYNPNRTWTPVNE